MKQFLIKLFILLIGICGGIFVSLRVDILADVEGTFLSKVLLKADSSVIATEEDNMNDLVLVESIYKDFVIDLKYATEDNITSTILYPANNLYLQRNTLNKLIAANEELKTKGYKLKIWDGYRPLSVQKKLWAVLPNSNYIANPFGKGSNHNRGAAVDVTIVNIKTGEEVNMPTGFDEFTSKCRRNNGWSTEESANVKLLTEILVKHGFTTIESEWWHFDDEDYSLYPVMDFSLLELLKK